MLAIVIGAAFMAAAASIAYSRRRLARIGQLAIAEVIELKTANNSGRSSFQTSSDAVYHLAVAFRTASGQRVRSRTVTATSKRPAVHVGQHIEVVYDPLRPWFVTPYPVDKPGTAFPVVMAMAGAALAAWGIFQLIS